MTHLKDNTPDKLKTILVRLLKNKIHYTLTKQDGKIVELDTKDKELIDFAKKNNPNLK
jgi:hypothetical protein|tara:strand:+ start:654 stop:827 length:174 start_codon:yes stop_codon:yes gene_type:complete